VPRLSRRSLLLSLIAARSVSGEARVHRKPKPLSKDAVTEDWPCFLGRSHQALSAETKLTRSFPPPLIWEMNKGTSYTSPAIAGDALVYLYRVGNEEIVECMHPETGASRWQFRYPTEFEGRFGYNNGPRSSPVIDTGRAYTLSAEGVLHCLAMADGKLIWKKDFRAAYKVRQDFFGTASTPLIEGNLLIVNTGAPGGPCVVALDKSSGAEVWRAGKDWGPSYASPVPAVIHGKRVLFVFAGGESDPPSGGLLAIDPANGRVHFTFPWRSRSRESVNASCPVVFDNRVFVSASYRTGSALIEVLPDLKPKTVWTTQEIGLHWNTAIYRGGFLYGFDGRNEPDASLVCVDATSGKVVWRTAAEWKESITVRGQRQEQEIGTYRGSLLAIDGQFLCLGEFGHLLWLDLSPKGYKEIARTWLFAARETWALPVVCRGLLYVSQNTREVQSGVQPRLLCYDLRASSRGASRESDGAQENHYDMEDGDATLGAPQRMLCRLPLNRLSLISTNY